MISNKVVKMLRNSKRLLISRPMSSISLCRYSNESQKKPPDLLNERKSPENSSETQLISKEYDSNSVTKEDLKWRKPTHETDVQHFMALRTFYREDSGSRMVKRLNNLVELTPAGIKKWFKDGIEAQKIKNFSYLPQRNEILGDELAAAHFIVSRGGAIKFHDEDKWIKADESGNYVLPGFRDNDKILEAIDCSETEVMYESLENFRNLKNVRWLSFNGCSYIDDWCLDVIGNIFSDTLVYLDLRNCQNISHRGLGALAKMNNLKILYLEDFYRTTTYELTCLLLQELNPHLNIKSDPVTFEVRCI